MKNKYYIVFIVAITFFTNNVFAATGNVVLQNDNQLRLANNDSVQFQLLTNANGLINSAVLPASSPDNIQVLSKWSFPDQTNSFTIYIRNVSQNGAYVQCTGPVTYSTTHVPINVHGWSDGVKFHCELS